MRLGMIKGVVDMKSVADHFVAERRFKLGTMK